MSSKNRYKDANGEWMPLSEQEKELDRMFAVVVQGSTPVSDNEETEAKKFRDEWLAKHRAEAGQGNGEASPSLPSGSDAYVYGDAAPTGALGLIFPSASASVPTLPSLAPPEPSTHARHPSGNGDAARGRRVVSAPHDNYRPDLVPLVDPSLPEVSPEDATAHRSPQARDRRSSEVSERVSRWLHNSLHPRSRSQSASRGDDAGGHSGGGGRFGLFSKRRSIDASIIPTPYCAESDARRADVGGAGRAPSTRSSIDSAAAAAATGAPHNRRTPARKLPPVPPSAFTPVKERHEPAGAIVITATSPSESPASLVGPASPTRAQAMPTAQSNGSRTSLDEQGNLRVRRVQVGHRRGRSITSSEHEGGGGGGPGSSSRHSHGHGVPALSPTRSASSSEMGLPATPTTDTHGDPPPPPPRDYRPGSSGGRSQSQQGYQTAQAPQASLSRGKSLPPAPTRPVPPLPEEGPPAEEDEEPEESDEESSFVEVDMEFGAKMQNEAQKMRALMAAAATASTRPPPAEPRRRPTLVGTLFKKDELEVRICSVYALHCAETKAGDRVRRSSRTPARRVRCRI